MSDGEAVEGSVEEDEQPVVGTALATTPALSVTPQVEAKELVKRLAVIREAMDDAMVDGVDYGRMPGIDKPTLLKPGSEKLGVLFQLDIQPECQESYEPGGHLTVVCSATVFHAPSGTRLGKGRGVCTTRERKYAYRKEDRRCPTCGNPTIIKGKQEYGGGWLCWAKKGGCGAKFKDGDQAIESQEAGEIDNPDLPDLWNTVVKMAEKRARIDAVLAVTGASALFTQDAEDKPAGEDKPREAPQASPKPTPDHSATASAPVGKRPLSARGVIRYRDLIEGANMDIERVVKEAGVESGSLADVTEEHVPRIKAIVGGAA